MSGVDRAHDVGPGGGVQAESTSNPGYLSCGEHKAQPQKSMVPEDHQARHQNNGLQKCGQAQTDDLLDPLYEAVHVPSGNAEHIQAANGNLDEQDAAPLQICKKDFDYCVGHKDDTKKQHDGTGNHTKAEIQCHFRHIRDALYTAEVGDNLLTHISDASSVASQPRAESPLKGYGQRIEADRQNREQACGQKSFDSVQGILSKNKKPNYARLHYLLKDDLMKMEAITQETRLLCRNRIDTVEQLLSYKGSLETEKADLLQKRKELYSKSRKTGGEEKEAIRSQLSDLSKRLSVIRKEVRLCEGIEARNAALKEKLSTIRADEEQQRKELMTNEYKRRSGRTNRPNELGRI